MKLTLNVLKTLWNDENGAAAAEYALILAIVGTAIAAAAITLGGNIHDAINNAATCVKTPTDASCSANTTP